MLVLSRRKAERIMIGSDAEIVIEVIQISGNRVRLGVHAPETIRVYRQEIWEKIQKEKYAKE